VADIHLDLINGVLRWLLEERQSRRLDPKLRHAIAAQLNIKLKQQQLAAIDQKIQLQIDDIEKIAERMRKNGELPDSGGIEKAALAEYAERYHIKPGTLEKAIQRYNKRGLEELANAFRVPLNHPIVIRARERDALIRREKSRQTRQAIRRKKSKRTPVY
jgi:hypothetical protein